MIMVGEGCVWGYLEQIWLLRVSYDIEFKNKGLVNSLYLEQFVGFLCYCRVQNIQQLK